jgi:hypothetical protein
MKTRTQIAAETTALERLAGSVHNNVGRPFYHFTKRYTPAQVRAWIWNRWSLDAKVRRYHEGN